MCVPERQIRVYLLRQKDSVDHFSVCDLLNFTIYDEFIRGISFYVNTLYLNISSQLNSKLKWSPSSLSLLNSSCLERRSSFEQI